MYAHVKRHDRLKLKEAHDLAKLVCTFINPRMSQKMFTEKAEPVENVGFYEDLKKIDPNFDKSKYEDIIEDKE